MGALVDDLLTLIQADAERTLTHERVDLADLLTGVIDDAAVIDPTRTWRLAGSYAPAVVLGDRLRLHQLFANLLANIRTHTPTGTVATVAMLTGLDEIAISVSDNGPGVSDEALHRLFDRFYRVDPSRSRENGGTGLGLSIVAAIVRSHGGQILASHTPGGGLTMTVVLPRPTGTAAVPPPGAVPPPRRRHRRPPVRSRRPAPSHRHPGGSRRPVPHRRIPGRPGTEPRPTGGRQARQPARGPRCGRRDIRKPDVHRVVRVFGQSGDFPRGSVRYVSRTRRGHTGGPDRACR